MNRTSTPRRLLAASAVAIAIVAWFGAVVVWTTTTRVTSAGAFSEVVLETVQSPDGAQAATDALLDKVDAFAMATGYTLTPSGRERISSELTSTLQDVEFPALMGPAVERAREAYEAAPDGPITIDFASLRPLAVARVEQVDPDLAKAIPPETDLTVTVQKDDVPEVASTIAAATDTLQWLPLWLLLGTLGFAAIALLASADRPRMMRVMGIASLVIAIVPVVLWFAVPPVAASFVEAGSQGNVVSTATSAVLGRWWIALIVCIGVGALLIAGGIYSARQRAPRRAPVVLGR